MSAGPGSDGNRGPAGGGRKAVRLRVTGRVQGVNYRAWTIGQAEARGLDGWVRNRPDGSVEALLAGPEADVDAVVEACRRGPSPARVDGVAVEPAEDPGPVGFARRPTG